MSLLDLIDEKRPEILRIAAKHGAKDLRLFGSVARGEDHEGSDVDLLADVAGYRDHLRLIGELQALLGVEVDVVPDPPLPEFRERILSEAIRLDAPDFREQAMIQSQRPHDPMQRDHERLQQMLVHCDEALAIAGETSREVFMRDRVRQYALVKVVEILCEYAGRISPEFKDGHPEIPWVEMAGFRNRAVHDYFRLHLDEVWDDTIQASIPALKIQLEALL